ncbi:Isy1-like splicing family protein [Colletotrichum graminicola]|nr:Isy1-like splicing family protein [Colletotrichum graminicola]
MCVGGVEREWEREWEVCVCPARNINSRKLSEDCKRALPPCDFLPPRPKSTLFPRSPTSLSVSRALKMQARNSEKAQSMLFRFREAQAADLGIIDIGRTRRPRVITEVDSIPSCEKWRGQVLKEISRKVSKIQDTALSDYQIRDLNDEINKLMREKYMWEVQIRNLGGPNYMRGGGKIYDEQGREIPGGGKGYRYFGRARDLPGVKELFEAAKAKATDEKPLETRDDLRKQVDAAYYGYAPDEEDQELLAYELAKEEEAFEHMSKTGKQQPPPDWEPLPGDTGDGKGWELPTLEEVQEELINRRRQKLLDQL